MEFWKAHRAMPLVRVDQHVDGLAQCAVGRQSAVVKQKVEASEFISFACDRLSLVISPKSTICCSDVIGVTRRTRDLGVDTGGCRCDEKTPV